MWLTSMFLEFISSSYRPLAERFEEREAWQDSRNKSEYNIQPSAEVPALTLNIHTFFNIKGNTNKLDFSCEKV